MTSHIRCKATLINQTNLKPATAGFTFLEMIIVVVIVGILAAIAAPGWNAFMRQLKLNYAQDAVHQAMHNARSAARRSQVPHVTSFRQTNGVVQWATHPASRNASTAIWNSLDPSIQLDPETTLLFTGGVYKIQFDEKGNVNGRLGRLTLSAKAGGKAKRCIIVSTLLGAIRKGQDHPKKQSDKYCY